MAEAEQCTEIKFSVPWGHVAAKTYGSSAGKPVLVIHGHLDNAGSFTRLMKYLPKELFYYVCIDLPGHGWSSHFPSWMMLDSMNYVHSLHFILEALQWETCICLGHSLGAQIALLFSTFQPNRFKMIISLDGIIMNAVTDKEVVTYFQIASAISIKVCQNKTPPSFTKEEVLHNLKSRRIIGALNSEAADALFERAVTNVNGKYIYNRDIRLRNHPFTFMLMDGCQTFNKKLSIPVYLFAFTHGIILPNKKFSEVVLKTMKAKIMLDITIIDGSHDVHTNNPEKVAPFICKILNSDHFSKL